MKLAVIIPTRGDRPEFIENCKRLLANQTVDIFNILMMDHAPRDPEVVDITKRYRLGYDTLRHKGYDLIAFIEDDDWYSKNYLQYMIEQWVAYGQPDLLGTRYTIYYHLKLRKYFTMRHEQRSSAMNMLIKPDLDILWPKDHDPFTDQWLWMHHRGPKVLIEPSSIKSIGMKHGVGLTGGKSHVDKLNRYINNDDDMYWLQNTVDEESYWFYKMYSDKLNNGAK